MKYFFYIMFIASSLFTLASGIANLFTDTTGLILIGVIIFLLSMAGMDLCFKLEEIEIKKAQLRAHKKHQLNITTLGGKNQ